jgi:hypothetical protein
MRHELVLYLKAPPSALDFTFPPSLLIISSLAKLRFPHYEPIEGSRYVVSRYSGPHIGHMTHEAPAAHVPV